MSIARMMTLGGARYYEQTHPKGTVARTGGLNEKTVDTAIERITAFIPSEVISAYIAGLGILSPTTDTGKWRIFGICLLLIPVFMLLDYLIKKKNKKPTPNLRINILIFCMALVAYVVWAAALPATPFLAFTTEATKIGGFGVLILAPLMYKVAELVDVVPKRA